MKKKLLNDISPEFVEEILKLKTLKEIIEYGTKKGGDKRQFIFLNAEKKEEERSFNQTWDEITALGTFYYLRGLDGKKKIAIIAENSYEWIVSYYATLIGGNIVVPMDIKLTEEEIVSQLVRSGCDAIVFCDETAHFVDAVKADPQNPVKEFFNVSDFPGYKDEGRAARNAGDTRCIDAKVGPDDLACIVYTSGTTGLSKGVMLSHFNVTSDVTASCSVQKGEHAMGFLPLNHTFCWVGALFSGYLLAEWGYINDGVKDLQKDMKTYKPQNFSAVPLVVTSIYDRIWRTAKKTGQYEKLQKGLKISRFLYKHGIDVRRKIFKTIIDNLGGELEFIICGGANLDPKYEQGMNDFGIQIINGYGMTECSPAITVNLRDYVRFGSVGQALPCNKIKIMYPDEFGVGEIFVQGTNVMQGYYNDPEATAEAFEDAEDGRWLRTGDYGRMDEDGYLYFVGRKKNLIVLTNGKNVSPEEIEDKLICIDYVTEVLVYQEDDKITAEFFLNKDEYPDCEEHLRDDVHKVNENLPKFKRVTNIKTRDTEFPKTTTMKIIRNREMYS
ncbi:MAG: AMP-binding protein [Clostridia bacterium]|nr:AMP-binding protein [Clostridia bacterium]